MSIFVDNLSFGVTEFDLDKIFRRYGLVKKIQIPSEFDTRHTIKFAFIEMATAEQEGVAIEGLRKFKLLGRELILNKARGTLSI